MRLLHKTVRFARKVQESPRMMARWVTDQIARPVANSLGKRYYTQSYFERLYRREDPWQHKTSEYESRRRGYILEAVRACPRARVFEAGCGEGLLTEFLAEEAREVVASEISAAALNRARRRVPTGNVRFLRCDLFDDPLPREFDLIVLTDVLSYWMLDQRLAARLGELAAKLAFALRPGGRILVGDAPFMEEFHTRFAGEGFQVVKEFRWPDYQILLLERGHSDA